MPTNLPKWLERTPEEIAEEAKVQELRKASFGRARMTPEERMVSRGLLLEQTARENLAQTDDPQQRALLAHALGLQGKFREAAEVSLDMKDHFEGIADAIDMDDSERCECPDTHATVDGEEISITPRYAKSEVYSRRHGKLVKVIRCATCGHTNAREARSRLLLQHRTETGNRAAITAGRGMVRDSQILKDATTR